MSNNLAHPFHLVDESPWPILSSFAALYLTSSFIIWFRLNEKLCLIMSSLLLILISLQWWNSVSLESTFQGLHTFTVQRGMRWGMLLFIVSEAFLFVSFFWAFYFSGMNPSTWMGGCWPPTGIYMFNPLQVPLLNTMILLGSGVTITWAHHSLMEANFKSSTFALGLTILLGFYFTLLQGYEYWEASFTMMDSCYGSCFFLMTGFHGFHVIIGTLFLAGCFIRMLKYHFSSIHHFMFEAAAWYWHFVDVVWLFLYISIYWWGGIYHF